ncbi:A24 family peptidase [Microbacterium betulae]|uniref:A24 family peptidase n=1 Tax=Microbacterium betulae TaxID=2981139 RepID=A0AA97FFC5_9MICO|nr:A24 family peptidase [Microbacterium sp. AB]WOF21868.1 A24 family peptidase [Microbacterium sp. AB]
MDVAVFIAALAYGAFLVVGAVLIRIDVQEHRLPNRIVVPSIVVLTLLVAAHAVASGRAAPLGEAVAGGLVLGAFYLALRVAHPEGMGGGDVKLAILVGVFLGWHGWAALAVGAAAAFVFGAAWALVLLLTHRAARDTRIAFGPWMVLGAWAGLLVA